MIKLEKIGGVAVIKWVDNSVIPIGSTSFGLSTLHTMKQIRVIIFQSTYDTMFSFSDLIKRRKKNISLQ